VRTEGWTIKRRDYDSISQIISLGNWKSVSFHTDSIGFLPNKRGIYIVQLSLNNLFQIDPFAEFTIPIYVGETIDIKRRFREHCFPSPRLNIRRKMVELISSLKFNYLELPGVEKAILRDYEQSLIDLFDPQLNEKNSKIKGVEQFSSDDPITP
jgi:hypothetical protein